MDDAPLDRIALMLVHERRMAFALAPVEQWRDLYSQRMLRLEFPGAAALSGVVAREQVLALCRDFFGCDATPLPTAWTYGPSQRHAVDRQPASSPDAPFLRYTRLSPPDLSTDKTPRPVTITLFRAAPLGALAADPHMSAGTLWLPLAALQVLIRGASVEEALRLADVEACLATGVTLPADGFIYLPADVGERMLPRIAAKYGARALFEAPGTSA